MYSIIKNVKEKKISVMRGRSTMNHSDIWYVSNEFTLRKVPGGILKFLYNKANPDNKIENFLDVNEAATKVFPLLEGLCPVEKNLRKRLNIKKVGVIKTFHQACLRPQGATILEMVDILAVKFPHREPASMNNTVRANINRSYIEKLGYEMFVTKEAGRKGKVYTFRKSTKQSTQSKGNK